MSEILWRPSADICQRARLTRYLEWLKESRALEFPDYDSLWQWSTSDLEAFWMSVWEYFDIPSVGDIDRVLAEDSMPGATWFTGTTVNYAAQVFRHATPERPAIVYQGEKTDLQEVSWAELEREVAALAAYLRSVGVQPGDRIVGYFPNAAEAVVAFLAAASVGAIWSHCAPDLGVQGVLDRFQQIQPKVLIAGDGYTYNGKFYDRAETIATLVDGLPELDRVIVVKLGGGPTLIDVETLPAMNRPLPGNADLSRQLPSQCGSTKDRNGVLNYRVFFGEAINFRQIRITPTRTTTITTPTTTTTTTTIQRRRKPQLQQLQQYQQQQRQQQHKQPRRQQHHKQHQRQQRQQAPSPTATTRPPKPQPPP